MREGRTSFLKKRSKKLLFICAEPIRQTHANVQKFFGSFFQKRTFLLSDIGWAEAHPTVLSP
jgi:hypothetical protein